MLRLVINTHVGAAVKCWASPPFHHTAWHSKGSNSNLTKIIKGTANVSLSPRCSKFQIYSCNLLHFSCVVSVFSLSLFFFFLISIHTLMAQVNRLLFDIPMPTYISLIDFGGFSTGSCVAQADLELLCGRKWTHSSQTPKYLRLELTPLCPAQGFFVFLFFPPRLSYNGV